MSKELFGFRINKNIYVDIENNTLINAGKIFSVRNGATLILKDTMFRLFVYLLNNSNAEVILNSAILRDVWDLYGLSSSNQRLWQVMNALKYKLSSVGLPDDFIVKINSKGYSVRRELITPLYTERKEDEIVNNACIML
ncbi:hypothetical protein IV503_19450 [Klebsiella huaxiensis]|uniref:winged helix-turn-helix domain-containing protein n=1 Tax=Klebsiella huaxiensis TaxID=2153354 RepID=UPI002F2EBF16